MIVVSGQPFDPAQLVNEYPENSVERQVLMTMSGSGGQYKYDSLDQLKFELLLRREIVNAAHELHKSGFSFAVFNESKANPEYWERKENGGFLLKDGANPAEAIRDIFKNGNHYASECATAMVIVFYKALLNVLPEAVFNQTFPKIYLMNWHVTEPLLLSVGIPRKAEDIMPGDRAYFQNPDVDPKTPEWQGENVIVLPGGMYYGHGIGIRPADDIIKILNRFRKKDAEESARFLDTVSRPDFKKLAEIYYSSAARQAS